MKMVDPKEDHSNEIKRLEAWRITNLYTSGSRSYPLSWEMVEN